MRNAHPGPFVFSPANYQNHIPQFAVIHNLTPWNVRQQQRQEAQQNQASATEKNVVRGAPVNKTVAESNVTLTVNVTQMNGSHVAIPKTQEATMKKVLADTVKKASSKTGRVASNDVTVQQDNSRESVTVHHIISVQENKNGAKSPAHHQPAFYPAVNPAQPQSILRPSYQQPQRIQIHVPPHAQGYIPPMMANPYANRVPYFGGFPFGRTNTAPTIVPDVAVGAGSSGHVSSQTQIFQNGRPASRVNGNQDFTLITRVQKFDGDLLSINYTLNRDAAETDSPKPTSTPGTSLAGNIAETIKKAVQKFRPKIEVDAGKSQDIVVNTQIYQYGRPVPGTGVDSTREFVVITRVHNLQKKPLSIRYTFLPVASN